MTRPNRRFQSHDGVLAARAAAPPFNAATTEAPPCPERGLPGAASVRHMTAPAAPAGAPPAPAGDRAAPSGKRRRRDVLNGWLACARATGAALAPPGETTDPPGAPLPAAPRDLG